MTALRSVLLVSHGTVDDLDDLAAFVTNVRRGNPPSAGLVAELRRRYEAIGGQSPLNAINALLASKLERKLGVPVTWCSRLWKPDVRDALSRLSAAGARSAALVPLAQYSAPVYAADARRAAEGTGINLVCAPDWGDAPKLCAAFAERIVAALQAVDDLARATVLMTAHSLPLSVVAAGDPYASEVGSAAEAVALTLRGRLGRDVRHRLAFQSQGLGGRGPDGKPIEWLGPDLRVSLDEIAARGDRWVVVAPIGFLADHVEILYDLDIEARAMATDRKLSYVRAASLNADDDLVDVLADVARPLLALAE